MTFSTLRSVSPLHIEYLGNMGVRATVAISLVQNNPGQNNLAKTNHLWGMVVCHHTTPRTLSFERRTICEFLGQSIAMELATKEANENIDYKLSLKQMQSRFVTALTQSSSLSEGLTQNPDDLLALTGSTGVAFCDGDDITLIGQTPPANEVSHLVAWLSKQFDQSKVYHTAALSKVYTPALNFEERTSGLLAISISQAQRLCVVWFRPEVLQTVNWAGNPNSAKTVHSGDKAGAETEIMSPRRSFALWQQTVERRSQPWKPCEIEAAQELQTAVIGLVLRHADELAQLNAELAHSNTELDAFAYIASHDLKEPLRGIYNYSSFLIEDYGDALDQDGIDKLNTLMRLTQRMENLINSLLRYSRLGRAALVIDTVDIHELVNNVIEMVKMSKSETVDFQVSPTLPAARVDRTQVAELFTNLITNGIKYNNKDPKQITIGHLSAQAAQEKGILPAGSEHLINSEVYFVQDNGIGIREKHLDLVFRIFKRLHPPKRFGGGTGAGLTISKKIVERHQGTIWLQSTYGEGSTFYFTLTGPKAE
ncbi:MAG: ATP-binding protein [Cyanobacteria bacterium J06632_3]